MKSRPPLLIALLHPLNLLMLGISVLAGLISAWWLFPVGLLLWLIMVVTITRSPSLRISHQMQKRTPLAQRFQRYFDRIERVQISIFNTLASAPSGVRRALQPIQGEVSSLTDQAHRLSHRMTAMENYRIVSQSQADLEADLQHARESLETATDPLVRREYEESIRSLEKHLTKLQAVSTQLDRVEAQLMSLSNEMDSWVAEVIRLQAMGAQEAARHVPALVKKIRDESTRLQEFEREAAAIRTPT